MSEDGIYYKKLGKLNSLGKSLFNRSNISRRSLHTSMKSLGLNLELCEEESYNTNDKRCKVESRVRRIRKNFPSIGIYNTSNSSLSSERSKSYSFSKAIIPTIFNDNLDEYKFNYKHKMTEFSSINLKAMSNLSYTKQLGRDKVGYLKELNKLFKRK